MNGHTIFPSFIILFTAMFLAIVEGSQFQIPRHAESQDLLSTSDDYPYSKISVIIDGKTRKKT